MSSSTEMNQLNDSVAETNCEIEHSKEQHEGVAFGSHRDSDTAVKERDAAGLQKQPRKSNKMILILSIFVVLVVAGILVGVLVTVLPDKTKTIHSVEVRPGPC